MNWRIRVVHTTGYRYSAPVIQSYNEARLTPRNDRKQNLVVSRVETTPATRLKIVSSSVVETGDVAAPVNGVGWADLRSPEVFDRSAASAASCVGTLKQPAGNPGKTCLAGDGYCHGKTHPDRGWANAAPRGDGCLSRVDSRSLTLQVTVRPDERHRGRGAAPIPVARRRPSRCRWTSPGWPEYPHGRSAGCGRYLSMRR